MPADPLVLPGPVRPLRGSMAVPTSKSYTNRALVAAAVAGGGHILDPLDCEDTRLLAGALGSAGWDLRWEGHEIAVGARVNAKRGPVTVDLGNSGTGARLMVALLACVEGSFVVDGSARLRQRPVGPLAGALNSLGAQVSCRKGGFPVAIKGARMHGGAVTIRPQVSSQFITALLLAAPLFRSGLELEVQGPLPSAPYLGLTADVLLGFGAEIEHTEDFRRWRVAGKALSRSRWQVEGDWSAAAFPLAAVAVAGGGIEVGPLRSQSRQGDRVVCEILQRAGLTVHWQPDRVYAGGPVTQPFNADLAACPDAFPALAAVAGCLLPGSRLTGLGNLIHKESDRLTAMVCNLRQLGARLEVGNDDFTVISTVRSEARSERPVSAAGDHRIAMAMAVTALCAGPVILDDPACVGKSFPGFWELWHELVAPAPAEAE